MSNKQHVHGQEYDPDAKDQFVMTEGRYYSFQFFIPLPAEISCFHQGGDITGMLWRKDETPNEWVLQYRFRHYRDSRSFDSQDEKHWYYGTLECDSEAVMREDIEKVIQTIAAGAMLPQFGCAEPLKVHYLEIHGDCMKFYDIIQKNPPFWMHSQQVVAE